MPWRAAVSARILGRDLSAAAAAVARAGGVARLPRFLTTHRLLLSEVGEPCHGGAPRLLCSGSLLVQSGEHYDIIFFLDDTDHTLIFETIVMRRVQDREVGAEFCLEEAYHSALDFYLMGALLNPEEA